MSVRLHRVEKNATIKKTENIFLVLAFLGVFLTNQVSFGLLQTWWLSVLCYLIIYIKIFLKSSES